MIDVIFTYFKGCKKHINQDIFGMKENVFWVIDGATEVFPNYVQGDSGSVYWAVNTLNRELMISDTSLPLKQYVKEAITRMRDTALQSSPQIEQFSVSHLPTYAICCIKIFHNKIEYLCLGDCSLYISNNPATRITDRRIEPFHLLVNAVKEQYKHDPQLYRQEVLKTVQFIKQYINKEDGYWIGSYDPEIIDHSVTGEVNVQQGDRFLLCTDGFRPSIDEENMVCFEEEDIFEKDSLIRMLDEQEKSEWDFRNKTGIDITDDKTVILGQL